MSYWQAYKKVTSTNLKFLGVFALVAIVVIAADEARKKF
jgi:hypothetical protein